jgi:hypothetical protein
MIFKKKIMRFLNVVVFSVWCRARSIDERILFLLKKLYQNLIYNINTRKWPRLVKSGAIKNRLIVTVIQNVSISKETNFYDENTCLGIESMKQVEFFHNVISTGFPGFSK